MGNRNAIPHIPKLKRNRLDEFTEKKLLYPEYTLAGGATGTTYANTAGGSFFDGTTDGTYNYAAKFSSGGIWRFDSDWTNGSFLFDVGGVGHEITTTYDNSDNTLWVHNWTSTLMQHFDMTGNLLGSFETDIVGGSSLALDHADGTLWMATHGSTGQLRQYSKAGVLLDTVTITGLPTNGNMLGGEFDFAGASNDTGQVLEPASLAIFGIGSLGLVAGGIRRRKRSA